MRNLFFAALIMLCGCQALDTPIEPLKYDANILKNPGFETGLDWWHTHSEKHYAFWEGEGRNSSGSLKLVELENSIVEAWQGGWLVHPGDKIIFSGWFKAKNATMKANNGAGLGWDLREQGKNTIFYTMNGPSTLSENWTYIYTEHIIPCTGHSESEVNKWYTSDGKSGTASGARAGVWTSLEIQDVYLEKEIPYNLRLTSWVQIWHSNTASYANIDDLELKIIPSAISC